MKTIATLFSGGEGVGVGARAAGLRHLWGIEWDEEIAQVARRNGFQVMTADVCDVDPDVLERPDVLHASPPCPNFSSARVRAQESDQDVELAVHVARFVRALRPAVFTLENVGFYRKSASWEVIRNALYECGYWVDLAIANAADFGVPQTRLRMLVRAIRGQMVPYLPQPVRWRGWYDAIEDLIELLPETTLARWQVDRMPDKLLKTVLLSQGISRDQKGGEYPITMREASQLAFTVTANSNMNGMRAFLVGGQFNKPAGCDDRGPQVVMDGEPCFTVTASYKGDWRAFIVDGGNAGHSLTVRMDDEPMCTVDAMRPSKHPKVACLSSGRIVRMSVRALARFQSFPDEYRLPERSTLAARVIGNAVPPLWYEKVVAQLVRSVGGTRGE